jgi:hypothetical protein
MLAKTARLRLSPDTLFMTCRILPALLLLVSLVLASPSRADGLTPNETLKLSNGRTAKILSISKIEYSKGVMALMVRYQTTLSVDQQKALGQEVDEVFKFAQKDAEREHYVDAIISSNEVPRGIIITTSRMMNFIYEKGADDKWTRLDRGDFMASR